MSTNDIQFEVRKRKRVHNEFWTVQFNIDTGNLVKIHAGQHGAHDAIVVGFNDVKDILTGRISQSRFRVVFDPDLGSLNLIDKFKWRPKRNDQTPDWYHWFSIPDWAEPFNTRQDDLTAILFENGVVRFEGSRKWLTQLMEGQFQGNALDVYVTDLSDPHILFGKEKLDIHKLIQVGFEEKRLWSFVDHEIVQHVLYHGQGIRINIPPLIQSFNFFRIKDYYEFTGVIDDHLTLSKPGPGKHVSLYLKDNVVWGQSHYHKGSPVESIFGNLRLALLENEDPNSFLGWVEIPPLLLRQTHPFEVVGNWQSNRPPRVLYKASNVDIGVLTNENTSQ